MIFIYVILFILMFGLGLNTSLLNFKKIFIKPKSIIIGLFCQIIILPICAILVGIIFELGEVFIVGLLILAVSSGGATSNTISSLLKGNVELSIILTYIVSLVSFITMPLIFNYSVGLFGLNIDILRLSFYSIFLESMKVILLPILLGRVFRYLFKSISKKFYAIIKSISPYLIVFLVVVFAFKNLENILKVSLNQLLSLCFYLILILLGVLLITKIFKIKERERITILVESVIQNVAQTLFIVSSPFLLNNLTYGTPAILYALMMNLFLVIYWIISKFKIRPSVAISL